MIAMYGRTMLGFFFFFNDPATPETSPLSLPAPLPISPPGPDVARLAIAEAQHVVARPSRNRGSEALDEPGPVVIVEDVEQPAVQNGVEPLTEGGQLEIGRAHV